MQIKTSYESLVAVLNLMSLVTNSKVLQEDMKVINFFVKDGKMHALSTDGALYCLDTFKCEYDLEGETNPFMVIRISEALNVLNRFSSLQRTTVSEVQLSTQQKGIVMTITEEPKVLKDSANFQFSDMYKNQISRFKLSRSDVRAAVAREIDSLVMDEDYIEMKSKDFQKYLEYMQPPMGKPKDIAIMHFDDEFVYSIMGNVFGIAMPNTLPKEIFSGLSLSLPYISFLKNVIPMSDTFKIHKEVKIEKSQSEDFNPRKQVILYIESGDIFIKLKVLDLSGGVSTDTFKTVIKNSIEVDKPYLLDSIKRIEGFDQAFIEINITEDELVEGKSNAEFIIKTQRNYQRIPVKAAHGSGSYKFMLRPESFSLLVFSHLKKDLDGNSDKINDLIICMDMVEKGAVRLCCLDKVEDWQTRYPRAPYKEAPLLDF